MCAVDCVRGVGYEVAELVVATGDIMAEVTQLVIVGIGASEDSISWIVA